MCSNLSREEKDTIMDHLQDQVGVEFERSLQTIATNFAEQGVTVQSLREFYYEELTSRKQNQYGSVCVTAY